MILIRQFAIADERTGNFKVLGDKTTGELRWPNDHEFGFDTESYWSWRRFLIKDLGLPAKSKTGKPFGYNVYKWGGNPLYESLFPGYDKEGNTLPLALYGRLDKKPPKKYKPLRGNQKK